MTDLPSREGDWIGLGDDLFREGFDSAAAVVEAFASGVLKTEAEWMDSIDWEAAGVQFIYESGPMFDPDSARAIVAAGIGLGGT